MKRLFTLVLIFSFITGFLIVPHATHAASNFSTDYRVTYSVQETGMTRAVLTVTLTNATTQYYASSYKMQLGFSEIKNLTAADPKGPLKPVVTRTPEGHAVDLTFNQKAVGQGDKLTFTITFDTPEVAKNHGKIWEISVPGIANPEEFSSFVVDVKVPPSFGKPTYIKPNQPNQSLTFTKEQLGKSGIAIAFGEQQLYEFELTYHLKNKNVFPIKTEIALPPTTNYQDVYLTGMEPEPNNVRIDQDGNWLAEYSLFPTQQLDVVVHGDTSVRLNPKTQEMSPEDLAVYTSEMPFWETSDPEVRELANQLRTPEAIYEYVIKTLKYDFSRVNENTARLGAAAALKNPNSAVCREFTDTFIAIARAAGIPAREVNGFAFTENPRQRPISLSQDILHAWPEYYDTTRKTWVMVDPTWGSTTGGIDYFSTLDNDHVAFVIKGMDSESPIPAGGYKQNNDSAVKDVHVAFTENITHTDPEVSIAPDFSGLAFSGFPIKGNVILRNTGSSIVPSQLFTVRSADLTPSDQMFQFSAIPPFGKVSVPVGFHRTSFLTNKDAGLTIRYNPQPQSSDAQAVLGATSSTSEEVIAKHQMKVAPFFMTPWGIGGTGAVFAFIIFIAAAKSGRLRFSRQR